MEQWQAVLIGILYAFVVGQVVGQLQYEMRLVKPRTGVWDTSAMSMVERAVYFVGVYAGQFTLVGAWLVLKVASNWTAWKSEPGLFNRFAIGTGLSLLVTGAGAHMAHQLAQGYVEPGLGVGLLALVPIALVWLTTFGPYKVRQILDPEANPDSREQRHGEWRAGVDATREP